MKKIKHLALASVLAVFVIGGCSQQAKDDYSQAGTDASSAAKETGKAISEDTENAGSAMKSGASAAEKKIADATANTKAALANDAVSGKVKQTLLSSAGLKADAIKVDTNGTKVTLSGSVPTADQKTRAVKLVRDLLGSGYTIDDGLQVAGS